jgi:glycosyltransferase involved in cell wall biosynthesis
MNVAIFTDNDFGKVNGVTTTLNAALEHAPDDLNLRVYTCDDAGGETEDYLSLAAFGVGIPFYREMKMYLPPVRQFLRHAAADGVDVVHLTTPGPVGLAAMWVASRRRMPIVGSFHTDLAEYARILSGSRRLGTFVDRYMRWVYGNCERILAPSEATREMLVRGGIDRPRIDIWRRGVSTTRFDPAKRSAELRTRWAVSDARPAIVCVGRVSKEKGLQMLQPFTRFLEYAGVAHRLVVVGDGPMRTELQSACPDALFTGTLRPDDVAVAMASADILLFPSRTDTAGNVVLEAQASGLPVLVSDAGGPCESIRPNQTGFVCSELVQFVRRAADLLRHPLRRQQFGKAARDYALTRCWDTALEPLYRAYADVCVDRTESLVAPHGAATAMSVGGTMTVSGSPR